jgi:hypothetical protein
VTLWGGAESGKGREKEEGGGGMNVIYCVKTVIELIRIVKKGRGRKRRRGKKQE